MEDASRTEQRRTPGAISGEHLLWHPGLTHGDTDPLGGTLHHYLSSAGTELQGCARTSQCGVASCIPKWCCFRHSHLCHDPKGTALKRLLQVISFLSPSFAFGLMEGMFLTTVCVGREKRCQHSGEILFLHSLGTSVKSVTSINTSEPQNIKFIIIYHCTPSHPWFPPTSSKNVLLSPTCASPETPHSTALRCLSYQVPHCGITFVLRPKISYFLLSFLSLSQLPMLNHHPDSVTSLCPSVLSQAPTADI